MTENNTARKWVLLVMGFVVGVICVEIFLLATTVIPTNSYPVITTFGNLNNLKTDCYVSGFIDGRGSVFEEQSTTGYHNKDLGMPEGYTSDRTKEWREYADMMVSTRSSRPITGWFSIDPQLISKYIVPPDISKPNSIRYSPHITLPKGCYENETGQDPNDLVAHIWCPENVSPVPQQTNIDNLWPVPILSDNTTTGWWCRKAKLNSSFDINNYNLTEDEKEITRAFQSGVLICQNNSKQEGEMR